ncbi:response regulator [uncultured Desulfobacter sp.]|uniref:response regulator transcription factor n=1 Tax=uncultured Desulfobacter sp. TaxID=240139 RepID=UPI002AAC0DC3|nr:response regulator [uncultured Desulfobacter sp.]
MANAIIADDSRSVRAMLRMVLGELGFTVVAEVENGKDAVAEVERQDVDLILLDINMPVMTGDNAIDPILNANPEVVIIIMTSVSERNIVEKCLNLGASNFIVKDNNWNHIRSTIQETWELNNVD